MLIPDRMRHKDDMERVNQSDSLPALLAVDETVLGLQGRGICKDPDGRLEPYVVLEPIARVLVAVPLELHAQPSTPPKCNYNFVATQASGLSVYSGLVKYRAAPS